MSHWPTLPSARTRLSARSWTRHSTRCAFVAPAETPADLAHHRIISIGGVTPSADWRFGKDRGDIVRLKPGLVVSNVSAALDLERADWGVTRALSYQIAPDLRAGTLQTVLEGFEPEPMPVQLVHQEGRRVTAKLRSFVDFARDRLRGLSVLND